MIRPTVELSGKHVGQQSAGVCKNEPALTVQVTALERHLRLCEERIVTMRGRLMSQPANDSGAETTPPLGTMHRLEVCVNQADAIASALVSLAEIV